ncbi:MAG: hypothetical protein E7294_12435 [Lachnospiraceae bacterium]|jgi:putative Mn2+ efflux pump MntP|nr:hypothetical protein [Lachnospiraceae bacterium]
MVLLCVIFGLILYLYAELICKGAVLARLEGVKLLFGTGIFVLLQLGMLLLGIEVAKGIEHFYDSAQMQEFTWVSSIFIFVLLAFYLLRKAFKNEPVEERRQEDVLNRKKVLLLSARLGIRTALAGMVLGFLEVNFIAAVIVFAVAAVVVFLLGLYSGYFLGYVYKTMAYIVSSLFLIVSAIYLIACFFVGKTV